MRAKGAVAPHLAAQLAERVLLGAAKDNNSGNRQLAAGNRGGIRTTFIKAKAGTGTRDQGTGGQRPKRREPGTDNRKRRTVSEVAIMARHGQVLPPVPAPGSNALCRIVLLSIAAPELWPHWEGLWRVLSNG